MTGAPILIVDDNPLNLKLARLLLSASGYAVRTASNADEAMAVLEGFRPKVILMDLQLPGIDGFELTRRLKARADMAGVMIVALTAYVMKGDEERSRNAGCDGYIAKPIDTRTLPGVVADYVRRADDASGASET